KEISHSTYFDKNNEFYAEAKLGMRNGQKPKIIQYKDEKEEMEKVYQYIIRVQECCKEEKVGIIIPSHKFKGFNHFMKEKGENLSIYNLKNEKNNITLGTYKQIKGLEFNTVIMPFLSKENFIKSIEIDNNELKYYNLIM